MKIVQISQIKKNPDNPRIIKDDKFKKLVESVKSFPEMLKLRPVVVDSDGMILGGNMRYEACKAAGMKEIPVLYASDLTAEQKKEFIIKDNISGGEWDWETLANDWDTDLLAEWGLELSNMNIEITDNSKEIEVDSFSDKMILKIELSEDDYHEAVDRLRGVSENIGAALMEVLRG